MTAATTLDPRISDRQTLGMEPDRLLLPEAWTLPFNTITEPYLQNNP